MTLPSLPPVYCRMRFGCAPSTTQPCAHTSTPTERATCPPGCPLPEPCPYAPEAAREGGAVTPIVKWVGGKRRLLPQLLPLLPPGVELMGHGEPFAGGAALFFAQLPGP